ncbi:oligosaccharide flippase family protein [Novosphingobium sp.]|uniref:lipopolysaccharide biosynthesis protein n=1 Tax=Novosphingobium sp. TaxID=1874826 RepID=UPI003341000B
MPPDAAVTDLPDRRRPLSRAIGRRAAAARPGVLRYARALGPTGVALALQFVTFAVTARGLGVAAFGLYATVIAVSAILIELLGCGFSDVLVRAVARDAASFATYFGLMLMAFAVTFVPVLLGGAGLLAVASGTALPFSVALVGLAGEMIAGRCCASTEAIMVAHGSMSGAAVVRMVTVVTRLVSALCYFAMARALDLWVWVVLGQSIALAIGLCLYIVHRYGRPRFAWSWQEWRAGLAFAVNQTARALQGNVDRLVLAGFVGPAALGAYAAGARLLVVGLFPIQVLTRMLYPEFFRQGLGGITATRRFAMAQAPVMLATGVGSLVIVAIVAQFLPQVLGHDFVASRNAAVLLATALPLIGLQYLAADSLTGAGHQGLRAGLAIGASLALGLLMVAGEHMLGGINGVIAGFVAGHALFLIVLIAASWRVARVTPARPA